MLSAIRLVPGAVLELSSELQLRNVAVADLRKPGELLVRPPGGSEWSPLCTCARQRVLTVHLPVSSCLVARGGELHLLGQHLHSRPAPGDSDRDESGSDSEASASEQSRSEALATLQEDVAAWEGLCGQRRLLAEAAAARGESWEQQARAQGLPISRAGLALHRRCARAIHTHGCEQGVAVQLEKTLRGMALRRAKGGFSTAEVYAGWEDVPGLPAAPGLRGVATDALSFPLTAAWLAEQAGASPDASGVLFLTILGPEAHSELSGRRKWLAALAAMPPAVTTLRILFIGPDLPEALDGRTEVFLLSPEAKEQASQSTARPLQRKHEGGARPRNGQAGKSSPRSLPEKDGWASSSSGQVQLAFIRGAYHAAVANAPLPWRSKPAAAIAFHPGLAEHRGDWEATMEALGEAGVPVGISAYHPPEAELDARALSLSLSQPLTIAAEPNRFASQLPHLDDLFPGRTYAANGFVCLAVGGI